MSKQAGFEGAVDINGVELDLARDAQLSINGEMIDVTARDSKGWEENIYGINSWGLTVTAVFKEGDATLAVIRNALLLKTELNDVRYIYKDGEGFKGGAKVESIGAPQPFRDAATYEIALVGNGAVAAVTGQS